MQAVCHAMAEMIRGSGMSVRTIAARANIPEATIRNILHGRSEDPRLSTVAAICSACGTSIEHLFRAADRAAQAESPEDDIIAAMEHLQRVIAARESKEDK